MTSRRGRIGAGAMLVAALTSLGAPRAASAAELSDAEVTKRLTFIESRLARAEPSAVAWWSAWFYGYLTVTVGEAGFAIIIKDTNLRKDTAVGAAFSSLGVIGLGVADFPARYAAETLRRLPADTPAERRRKLAKAEKILSSTARSEVIGRSWIPHVAGSALSLTSGLVMALAYHQVASGIVTFVSGVGITEAQIFTKPTAAITDWNDYQRGAFSSGAAPVGGIGGAQIGVVSHPGGAGIRITF